MEKSLKGIEASVDKKQSANKGGGKVDKAAGILGGLGTSLDALVGAISVSMFDPKKGEEVIVFSEKLVKVANEVKSKAAKDFGEFAKGLGEAFEVLLGIMSPIKILKLKLASKILFEGKKPLLSKIVTGMQKAFQDIDGKNAAQGAKALKFMAEGLITLSKAVGVMALLALAAPLIIIGAATIRLVIGMFVGLGKKAKQIEEGGKAMNHLGKGLMLFSAGLATIVLVVALAGASNILSAMATIAAFALVFATLGLVDRHIRQGARALALVGLALFAFSAGLASFMLAVIISTPKLILEGMLIIAGMGVVFALLGIDKVSRAIAQGALLMIGMAVALFLFSAGLMVFGLAVKLFTLEDAMMGALLITEIGLAMALLGKFGKRITEGTLVMAEMGVALALFSVGALLFGLAVKIWKIEDVIIGASLIASMGIAFAIVGGLASNVTAGAAAVSEMGAALLIFSAGIVVFGIAIKILGAMFDSLLEAGGITAGIIFSMGVVFAGIGLMSGNVLVGAAAVAAMGTALITFSLGILIFAVSIKILGAMFDDLVQAGIVAAGILLGLGLAFAGIGLLSAPIILGAAAVSLMGVSLILFSVGLILFGASLAILMKSFGSSDTDKIGPKLRDFMLQFGLAFSAIGLLSVPIILGAAAVLLMGVSLATFGIGIAIFAGSAKLLTMALGQDDLSKIGGNVRSFLIDMGLAFSSIGLLMIPIVLGSVSMITMGASLIIFGAGLLVFGSALMLLDSKGLLVKGAKGHQLKGISILSDLAEQFSIIGGYSLNPFMWMGIGASIGMGFSLMSIGYGLQAAGEALAKIPDMSGFITTLFGDSGLIPSMAKAFSDIGDKYGGGLLSNFLGTDSVSVGIKTVKGFGNVLKELAGGIAAFANFSEFPILAPDPKDPSKLSYKTVDILGDVVPKLTQNLPTLLGSLATIFADIGNKFGGDGGWFGDDSPVQKGVSAVKGLGGVLKELAGGIVAFANFEEFAIQVPDAKDPSKLIYKTVNLFETIPKIKKALVGDMSISGKLTGKTGILFALAEVFAEIGTKFGDGFFSDGPVKKGVDAVKGIGGVISELAGGIIAFANMNRGLPNYDKNGKFNGTYTPFKLETVQQNISKVLTSLPKVFANVDISKFEEAKEKAEVAVPLAEAIGKIGEALIKLKNKAGKDAGNNEILASMGTSLKGFVQALKGMDIDEKKVNGLNKMADAIVKLANAGNNLKTFASALSDTAVALTKFSASFKPFSTQLDKFSLFEKSFSNLAKNASQYKFTQFAKDVGTLKDNINKFELEKLKLTDSMMKSLAILSKSPDALGKNIEDSIEKAFKELVQALKELVGSAKGTQTATTAVVNDAKPKETDSKPETANNKTNPIDDKKDDYKVGKINTDKEALIELARVLKQFTFVGEALKVTR